MDFQYNFAPLPWTAVEGDIPELMYEGERTYFPHIIMGEPRIYEGHVMNTITINEIGPLNGHHDGLEGFDCTARLIASAPKMAIMLSQILKGKDVSLESIEKLLKYIDTNLLA